MRILCAKQFSQNSAIKKKIFLCSVHYKLNSYTSTDDRKHHEMFYNNMNMFNSRGKMKIYLLNSSV